MKKRHIFHGVMTAEEFLFIKGGKACGAAVLISGNKIMIRNRVIVKRIGSVGGLIVNTVANGIGIAAEGVNQRI